MRSLNKISLLLAALAVLSCINLSAKERIPGAPTAIQAAYQEGQGVTVSWTRQEQNATYFRVTTSYVDYFVCNYNCTLSYTTNVNAPNTSFLDTKLPPGVTGTYYVSACDNEGCVGNSSTSITTPVGGPFQISGKILTLPDYEPIANARVEITKAGPYQAEDVEVPLIEYLSTGGVSIIDTSTVTMTTSRFYIYLGTYEYSTLPPGDIILVTPSLQEVLIGRTEQMSNYSLDIDSLDQNSPLLPFLNQSLEKGTWKIQLRFDDPAQMPADYLYSYFYFEGNEFSATGTSNELGRYSIPGIPLGTGYTVKAFSADGSLIGTTKLNIRSNMNSVHFLKQ